MGEVDVRGIARTLKPREREFLIAVCDGTSIGLADREGDKARQACRKRGLVEVLKNPRRWAATDLGLAVRQALQEGL